jgi:hypothetical protein
VFGIEESKAATDAWRAYKGHFTQVSAGEFNTWGLDSNTGALAWTRNADLNPFDGSNWQSATNDARHLSYPSDGPVVDVHTDGAQLFTSREDGVGGWSSIPLPAGFATTVNQVAVGATGLWMLDATGKLWTCALPCSGGSGFSRISTAPAGIISIDAGKIPHEDN